ncbi:glutaredoxin family protein [Actomonas aquatica]|uniref:Glutaredoxin family protein n=1 Tax=Actomonas aquatica TaxID=2866162 RepID=A0ABZ1CBH7_9BACT|nr:glutaredoxin family protein [Opitutus sp. WL0086]WRQ89036.1 glutaredoxin family protein [Opitutus sp. WL0086]
MPRKSRPTLFVGPGSSSCLESIRLLSQEHVDYEQVDVSRDESGRDKLIRQTGRCQVPTLVWGRDIIANFRDWELRRFVADHRVAG